MLYVTTRIHTDAFTARHALTENRGPEGGFYLPMRMGEITSVQHGALGEKTFGQNVADVMNLLFNTELDGWTVEFAIGRYPMRMVSLSGKVTVAEVWHNPQWQFERLARNLTRMILNSEEDLPASDWMMIASRIAMLVATHGEMLHGGQIGPDGLIDVVVPCFDFSAPMAAYYARMWGLPIGNIVICCNENNAPWNLLHHGQLRTDAVAVPTKLQKCDYAVPPNLERLIYSALGPAEAKRYCEICRVGGCYDLQPTQRKELRRGMYVSVISQQRTESMISGIYKSNGCIVDPYTALAYSGLMDYRAQTGESRPALILSEESPAFSVNMIAASLGISRRELKERINKA